MSDIIRIGICSLCYCGILTLSGVKIVNKKYFAIFALLIIQAVVWGTWGMQS